MMTKDCEYIFTKFFDTVGKIVLVFDALGAIIYANKTAIEELGLDQEAYPNMEDIIPSYMDKKLPFYSFSDEFQGESFEMVMYRSNHVCFPVEIRFGIWEEYSYGFCMASNLARIEELKHDLARAENETKELRDVRNSFVANVTHELRTPLNGMKGHLVQLESLEGNTSKHLDIYRIMTRCSMNMEKIINNILDFNKLQSGKFQIEETEFSLSDCVQQVYETNEMKANEKGLNFSVHIDEDIPDCLYGDGMHLQQILNNLVSNAIKFTASGFVKVKVVKVYQLGKKIELFFVVVDSGIGISTEERDKIFDSFVQADASITRKYGGTGLGLSITKDLLQMMGSSINLESEKGRGSTFSFSLVLQSTEEQNVEVTPVRKEASGVFKELELERQIEEQTYQVGTKENIKQLTNNMEKLILCIEIGNWEKAEQFAAMVKQLISSGEQEWKKQALRLEMAVRKENYDKSVAMYEQLKELIEDALYIEL
ncbi:MAG: hypothetical protein IJD40_10180 [Lachnospiraceae bacterium]|nr:hypothetical protein [Lachnospiraceae bacterium]